MPIVLLLLLLLAALPGRGQHPDTATPPPTELRVAYVGALRYPGLRIGLAAPVRQVLVSKHQGRKVVRKDRLLALQLGGYHHRTFHTNVYLTAEWQCRRTGPRGWFSEFVPGLGFSRTFVDGTTYEVDDVDGTVRIVRTAGHSYALLMLGGGAGYDFAPRHHRPMAAFLRASLLTMLPYNRFLYVRPTLEVGITYHLPALPWLQPRRQTVTR